MSRGRCEARSEAQWCAADTDLGHARAWLTRCYRTPYSARSEAMSRLLARSVQPIRDPCTIFLNVENQRGGSFAPEYQALDCQYRTRARCTRACVAAQNICRFGPLLRFAKICPARNREACRGRCLAARRAGGVRGVRVRDCHSARRILKSAQPTNDSQVQPAFRPPEGNLRCLHFSLDLRVNHKSLPIITARRS